MARTLENTKLLSCVLCRKDFTLADVDSLNYFPSTGICRRCYTEAQNGHYRVWCFGKETVKRKGVTFYGFNSKTEECSSLCPDKRICELFIKQKRRKTNGT